MTHHIVANPVFLVRPVCIRTKSCKRATWFQELSKDCQEGTTLSTREVSMPFDCFRSALTLQALPMTLRSCGCCSRLDFFCWTYVSPKDIKNNVHVDKQHCYICDERNIWKDCGFQVHKNLKVTTAHTLYILLEPGQPILSDLAICHGLYSDVGRLAAVKLSCCFKIV